MAQTLSNTGDGTEKAVDDFPTWDRTFHVGTWDYLLGRICQMIVVRRTHVTVHEENDLSNVLNSSIETLTTYRYLVEELYKSGTSGRSSPRQVRNQIRELIKRTGTTRRTLSRLLRRQMAWWFADAERQFGALRHIYDQSQKLGTDSTGLIRDFTMSAATYCSSKALMFGLAFHVILCEFISSIQLPHTLRSFKKATVRAWFWTLFSLASWTTALLDFVPTLSLAMSAVGVGLLALDQCISVYRPFPGSVLPTNVTRDLEMELELIRSKTAFLTELSAELRSCELALPARFHNTLQALLSGVSIGTDELQAQATELNHINTELYYQRQALMAAIDKGTDDASTIAHNALSFGK